MTTQAETTIENEVIYRPKDAINSTIWAVAVTGGAGTLISAVQNTLQRQNVGAMGFLTKTGSTIAVFAAAGGAYEFTKTASANLREREDTWNHAVGGFFGGAMVGLPARTMPAVLGYGAGLSIILATFQYTGGLFAGFNKDEEVDETARKEAMRKNRRRPIQETIAEMGEGRGIHAPGYEERRRQRIKERYGIDVNPGAEQSPDALGWARRSS